MTTPQTGPAALPPAGWYPDPQNPSLARWWDGQQWFAATMPATSLPVAPRRPPLGVGWRPTAIAAQVVFAVAVVADLAAGAISIWASRVIRGWYDDPASADLGLADTIDDLEIAVVVLQFALLLVGGILMIVWLYRAHASDRMNPAALRHGSGWAIGGWFVPVLALWRPYQMVRDVERGATSGMSSSPVVGLWWAGWLGSRVMYLVASAMMPEESAGSLEDLRRIADAYLVDAAAQGVDAIAAVLAIATVRSVTRRVLAAPASSR